MKGDLTVVLPWRDTGCPFRRAHFWMLRHHYGQHFPVVVGDSEHPEFNRSAARNRGVLLAETRVVAIVDADNFIEAEALVQARTRALETGAMVKPFDLFGYLSREATESIYEAEGSAAGLPDFVLPGDNGRPDLWEGPEGLARNFNGGAYVLTREAWHYAGQFDEGFQGWGAEDDAFTIMCQRTVGVQRVPGTDYHLWHPTESRWTSAENYERLMSKYVNVPAARRRWRSRGGQD